MLDHQSFRAIDTHLRRDSGPQAFFSVVQDPTIWTTADDTEAKQS